MEDAPRWSERPVQGQRTSAVDYVLADLRGAIESGAVGVGERLPAESALAARYGVSRAVIREVLRSCEAAGLTVTRAGRGTFVVAAHPTELVFDGYSALHLMEARPGLEVPAAGLAAVRRTEEQLAELKALAAQMEAETDADRWTRYDSEFHLAIARASGNPVYADVLRQISSALRNQSGVLNAQVGRRRESSIAEHRAIVSALDRGSALEAEDAMRYHLDEVRDALGGLLAAPGDPTRD